MERSRTLIIYTDSTENEIKKTETKFEGIDNKIKDIEEFLKKANIKCALK